jgi:uncharacterized protein YqjF (DUF2071 family)
MRKPAPDYPPSFLAASARQAATLDELKHRPWPLPDGGWAQAQTWEELLFAHWTVDLDAVRAQVPSQLEIDTFEGRAYLGLTPFRVTNLRLRGLPPLPVLSSFLELNCRTYVTHAGRPGIWFFSLDASSRFAVEAARRLYKLPYFRAHMTGPPRFTSVRAGAGRGHLWESTYEPGGPASPARAGTLEHFLSERYCLYTVDEKGALHRADIHHLPWALQDVDAEVLRNTMPPRGLEARGEPHVMFSARQDVLIWPLEAVS